MGYIRVSEQRPHRGRTCGYRLQLLFTFLRKLPVAHAQAADRAQVTLGVEGGDVARGGDREFALA